MLSANRRSHSNAAGAPGRIRRHGRGTRQLVWGDRECRGISISPNASTRRYPPIRWRRTAMNSRDCTRTRLFRRLSRPPVSTKSSYLLLRSNSACPGDFGKHLWFYVFYSVDVSQLCSIHQSGGHTSYLARSHPAFGRSSKSWPVHIRRPPP